MALSRYVLFANPHLKPTEAIFWAERTEEIPRLI
jgi:hypothetical protein